MIVLRNLTKIYRMAGYRKVVADNINAVFPTGVSVGLLGRNGAGKSTLLRMIAGTVDPTSGEILSDGAVSFPVGLASSLHPDLTGAQNTRFVARIYGADTDELMDWVQEFAELGTHFHLPVRTYSSGMRGRLSFGINMGLRFDTYLIDEITAVGDASFKRKSRDIFVARMQKAGAVFVSHSMGTIRELCQAGALIEDGKLSYYPDVEEAIDRYMRSLDPERSRAAAALPGGAAATDFPYEARMVFGMGLGQTLADWAGDCLRRHRACHFGRAREPHYFDIRAGQAQTLLQRRMRTARDLANRLAEEDADAQRNTLRLLGEVSELLAVHAAPREGPDRHATYVAYLLAGRKNQPVICDFTPAYALLPETELAEMAAIGSARFVVVLRDPATRLWAQIWSSRAPAERDPATILRMAQRGGPSAWPESDYAGLLARLDRTVPAERILCLFHERLPERAELDRLTAFLDIPPVPAISLPPLPADPVPPCPPEVRATLARMLAPQYAAVAARLGSLPAAWDLPDTAGAA